MGRKRRSRGRELPAPDDPLPPEFRAKMESLLGAEAEAFFAGMAEEVGGLRVNTLRADPRQAVGWIPFQLEPLPQFECFRLAGEGRPGTHPYHAAGLYYLQDPSAMVVGALVDPRPGERVADLSAAPGGKATHLAARMTDTGFLLANDINPTRARELAGNLERFGIRNAVVTIESIDRLAMQLGDWFHRVLLDAPCSGEAMFHRSAAAREGWSENAVGGCAQRQEELLGSAARLVMPGGLLVYSTCTFSAEENERVIAIFLREHPNFELEEPPAVPGARPGRPEWVETALSTEALRRAVRLWPHAYPGRGHFIALLRRRSSDGSAAALGTSPGGEQTPTTHLDEFIRTDLLLDPGELGTPVLRGSEIFGVPGSAPDLTRLRVLRPGWWLGTAHRDRFQPAHALAMGLRPGQARSTLDLAVDDPRVAAYLRGETLREPGGAGWLVVQVNGLPLGWGKRVGETVKNHLPKGLRTLG